MAFGTVPFITDARLLKHYFDTLATVPFTDEQKRRITGFGNLATMTSVDEGAGRINVTEHCSSAIPAELLFDPVKNRTGARCTVYDHAVNVYGRDPQTGFARRPLDNVGVQYGLAALNSGAITKTQFLELNEKIGGFDHDGNMVTARTSADPAAIRAAYRSGLLLNGGRGLASTPIIDYRAYRDDLAQGDIHIRYTSFATRERLRKANGHVDNHIMLTDDRKWSDSLRAPVLANALAQMDQWLTALTDDTSNDPTIVKVRRAKPADLVDACWTRDDAPQQNRRNGDLWIGPLRRVVSVERCSAGGCGRAGGVRHRQMPAQADCVIRLRGQLYSRRDDEAQPHLSRRCVRLVQARRRTAAADWYVVESRQRHLAA